MTISLTQTSVAQAICSALNNIPSVLILSQDAFYNKHSPEEVARAFNSDFDFGELWPGRGLPQIIPIRSTWGSLLNV